MADITMIYHILYQNNFIYKQSKDSVDSDYRLWIDSKVLMFLEMWD